MTRYEYIVSKGPRLMAEILAMSKLRAMEKIMDRIEEPFEVSDEVRKKCIEEHYEFLMAEVKEDTNVT